MIVSGLIMCFLPGGMKVNRIASTDCSKTQKAYSGSDRVPVWYARHADGSTERFGNDSLLGQSIIRAIYEDTGGNIWVGTETRGLFRLNKGTAKFEKVDSIDHKGIRDIAEDGTGNIWISGANTGLTIINQETRVKRVFANLQAGKQSQIHESREAHPQGCQQ